MHCPFCRHPDSRVVDSRTADDGAAIRRRRQCPHCSRRFTTVENASLTVIKRSGVTEPFSRDKVIAGVRKACQGRPVTEDALAQLGQRVEEAVRATGSAELSTHDVGLAILGPLQDLDLVAYLRFASVYKAFESLEDFEAAIAELRDAHPPAAAGSDGSVGRDSAQGGSARDGSAQGGSAEGGQRAGNSAGGDSGGGGQRPGERGGGNGASGAPASVAAD
ncbi:MULTISPECIES: transcriptional regulator NrdR [unclassified Streptomyces]|uniref:transcriptional regulator NrdR n=1 Tax=unclassified Streptomyces TaxID=2593676 RepID=UPI002DDAE2F1|nr:MULTISPECIES: transcriptional regulator NrdR [unclassified Streptomyces]WSA91974.1 transcriptional regulator NrdR [Streptomyces sp. NBC_01795]WSB76341.1 transcriptional regulator NrdR [Streptomyces sp. NBC_01775]WSS44229.1 transcriptional regulator NrdR [Streptomyces sp. NBC_01187]